MVNALQGAVMYEFRMQVRRRSVWVMLFGFAIVLAALTISSRTWTTASHERTALLGFADVASLIMLLTPVAVGVLLADRLPRDRTTRVQELLESLPAPSGSRIFGKYLGSTAATMVPVLITYGLGIGYLLALRGRDFAAFPLAMLPFVAVVLPGCLFVAAFSIACTAVIWTPLYQFLFIGYWFWGNLLQISAVPTLNGTLLTPAGDYMLAGFFGADGNAVHHATEQQATESVLSLLALGACALIGVWLYQRWRGARL